MFTPASIHIKIAKQREGAQQQQNPQQMPNKSRQRVKIDHVILIEILA